MRIFCLFTVAIGLRCQLTSGRSHGTLFPIPTDFFQCASHSLNDTEGFPDITSTVPDIIKLNEYPLEVHNITTSDGYILTVFRIYNSRRNFTKDSNKVAVMIQHGFLASSVDWVLNPINKSLGFKLADAGFDVWLGNARGTNYSLGHVNLSHSDDVSYWNFSVHEMGKYDLPAVIDHILEENGQKDLYFIGHSLGSVMFFIMTSERPEYNQKIRTMIALAPTVFRSSNSSVDAILNPLTYGAQSWYSEIGRGRLVPSALQKYLPQLFGYGCTEIFIRCSICQNALFLMYGYDPYQMEYGQLPTIMAHHPDSVSTKTFIHLSQMSRTGLFQQFDYNPYPGNPAVYGSGISKPPSYDLNRATVPVVIIKGLGDTKALPNNVDKLARALPNVKENYCISFPHFNHLDFLFAKDVNFYLYDYLLLILETNKYYE